MVLYWQPSFSAALLSEVPRPQVTCMYRKLRQVVHVIFEDMQVDIHTDTLMAVFCTAGKVKCDSMGEHIAETQKRQYDGV